MTEAELFNALEAGLMELELEMTINSRQKGAAAERELANILKDHGYDARRGQQFHGGGDSPDVVGLPGFHVEAKRVEAFQLYPALDQSTRDAANGRTPIVVHRRNGREWVVVLRLEDFLALLPKPPKLANLGSHDWSASDV